MKMNILNGYIRKLKESYGGLSSPIYILFIARIINRMGGFVSTFLAMFLQLKLGMDDKQISYFIATVGIISLFSPILGGIVADVKGRKKIYIIAQVLAAILLIPCGFLVNTMPQAIPFLLIASAAVSNVIGPINSAMVADLTSTQDERRKAYALLYLGINIGVALGPLIGGFLFDNYIKLFFIGDAVTTLISVVLVGLFVKETKLSHDDMKQMTGSESFEEGSTIKVLLKKPIILIFAFFSLLAAMVYAQGSYGLPLYLGTLFENAPKLMGMLMSFNAIIVLILTVPLTEGMKQIRPIYNMAISSILYAVGFGMMAFIHHSQLLFFISVFIWTLGEIIGVTFHSIFIISHTPVNHRGRFNAFISFIRGSGHFISPLLMSAITISYGYQTGWIIIGVLAMIGVVGFVFTGVLDKKYNKSELYEKKR